MQFPSNPTAGMVVSSVAQSFIYQNGGWVSQPVPGLAQDSSVQSIVTALAAPVLPTGAATNSSLQSIHDAIVASSGGTLSGGSVGVDYSTNKPSLPLLGASFSTGVYSAYTLLTTVPASLSRSEIEINNTSGGIIIIILDDGTAATGAALTNASVFSLNGDSVGFSGGSWSSTFFKGRIQIFSLSATAQVFIHSR